MNMHWKQMIGVVALVSVGFGSSAGAQPAPQERVTAIKQSLEDSKVALRQYEWVETTIISVKGEEKSRTQQRCYYGADGKIQKVALAQPAQQDSSGGRRDRRGGRVRERIVERKTEQVTEYMQRAVQTVHSYLPPDPALIQQSKDAGKVMMQPLDDGHARITVGDYMRPGDAISIELDLAANRILALGVETYIEDAEDAVSFTVTFGELVSGVSYQSVVVVDAPSQNVTVTVQNSGYRRLTP